jgi:hypothetical protein
MAHIDESPFSTTHCRTATSEPRIREEQRALGNFVLEGVPVTGLGAVGFKRLISAISQQNGATVSDTFGALGAGDFVGGSDGLSQQVTAHQDRHRVPRRSGPLSSGPTN